MEIYIIIINFCGTTYLKIEQNDNKKKPTEQ